MTGKFDVVIVGAGLVGLQMLHRVHELGLTVRVFETGEPLPSRRPQAMSSP